MSEWKNFSLGEVCVINANSYSKNDNWTFVNYLDTGNITANKIESIQHINILEEKLPSRAKRKVKTDSIIYSTVRPNQRHYGIIKSQPKNFLVSTGFAVIDVNPEIVDANFLYYRLTQNEIVQHLQSIAEQSTTAYPSIRPIDIGNLKFELPPLDTQKKIAAVLSALDDKIELNNAINKNLEEQILTLYLNSLEDNKCVTNELRNFCSFQEGYVNPKQGHAEFFNGEIKWLRAVDVNESYVISTTRTLTKAGYESAGKSAVFFEPDTIAISKSGTIGRLGIVGDYMCGNRAVINVKPKQKFLLPFIYAYLKASRKTFIDFAVGSVQKNLYVSILEPLTVKIPSQEILLNFCKIAGDNLELIKVNCFENQKLGELRDALLPRLMSGEIDVSAVEI